MGKGVVAWQDCDVTLDVWPQMTHDFQAHGCARPESGEAIDRIRAAIAHYRARDVRTPFETCAQTELRSVRGSPEAAYFAEAASNSS
ncbi:MAG: hypothetical protein H6870_07330 [Methylobacteriaceae bacterium]|nr:hypothetical protein [Methylobacteriaceae bacterium]